MKFIVTKDFWERVPDAYFGVIIAHGFDNTKDYPFINEMLVDNTNKAKEKFLGVHVKENELILPYRDAFRALDINPNKYMCAIEALLTRISKGNDLPSINPIVDLGNALSVKHMLPVGVHDIDNFTGDIEIRRANADDVFVPFNSAEEEHPDIGEFIYATGNEVKTRRWTWRQGERSKITDKTTNLFIPIDGFISNKNEIKVLQDEFAKIFKDKFRIDVKVGFVDKDHPIFEW